MLVQARWTRLYHLWRLGHSPWTKPRPRRFEERHHGTSFFRRNFFTNDLTQASTCYAYILRQ